MAAILPCGFLRGYQEIQAAFTARELILPHIARLVSAYYSHGDTPNFERV
jgi:hypothetical protein